MGNQLRYKIEKEFKERPKVMIMRDIQDDQDSAEGSKERSGTVSTSVSKNKQLKSILGKIHLTESATQAFNME